MERSSHSYGIPLLFSMIQQILTIWSMVPLPFINLARTSGSSQLTYYWSLAWRILSITLLACEMCNTVWSYVHSLTLLSFGIGMKTNLFQSCGQCWVFQIFWHIDHSTLAAPSFRIWNQFTSVVSSSLRSYGLQHARLPCPSPNLKLAQTQLHWVGDVIQPSHPLSSLSLPAFNLSQHQGLF